MARRPELSALSKARWRQPHRGGQGRRQANGHVAADAKVYGVEKRRFADVKAGDFVASGGVRGSDGKVRAVELRIYPESLRGVGEGQRPWAARPENGCGQVRSVLHLGENITVIHAKAGVQGNRRTPWPWTPACAGMTMRFEATPLWVHGFGSLLRQINCCLSGRSVRG